MQKPLKANYHFFIYKNHPLIHLTYRCTLLLSLGHMHKDHRTTEIDRTQSSTPLLCSNIFALNYTFASNIQCLKKIMSNSKISVCLNYGIFSIWQLHFPPYICLKIPLNEYECMLNFLLLKSRYYFTMKIQCCEKQ